MKWIVRILIFLVVLIGVAFAIGYALPAHTTHTRTITIKQTPDAVFALLADVQGMPKWNRHMEKVEMLPPVDGKEATKQTFEGNMVMTIITAESAPPTHLVRTMGDVGGPFRGSWTYDISPMPDGSQIVLTEQSEVKSPIFRLMMRIFGSTKYMDEHLGGLARHFGEAATIR
jgi:uncharacterized protein YndB with AHSA1/START domain